jgi:hypothetical protein
VLLAFHVGAISDHRLAEIQTFARQPGCQVWIAGHTAQTDEWFVPRNTGDLAALRKSEGFTFSRGFGETWQEAFEHPVVVQANPESYFGKRNISLQEADDVVFDEFFRSPAFRPEIRFLRPENVLVHSQTARDGRLLIHFRDQSGGGGLVDGAQIRFESGFPTILTASIAVPGSGIESIPVNVDGDQRSVTLPPFRYYALVVLETGPAC